MNAVNSNIVPFEQLLPPDFPSIQLFFWYKTFETKIHTDYPGERTWHCKISRDFEVISDAIWALSDINTEK